jgi:hypothetical protein
MSATWPANVRPLPVATTVAQEGVAIGDVGTVAGLNPEVHRSQLRIALRLAAAEQGRLLHVPGLQIVVRRPKRPLCLMNDHGGMWIGDRSAILMRR